MSDLLSHRKKNKNLERPKTIEPKHTFELNDENEAGSTQRTKKIVNRATSVRVSQDVQHKLNALVNLGVGDNANTVIDILADEYISNILSSEEKKQLKFMQEIYSNRKSKL